MTDAPDQPKVLSYRSPHERVEYTQFLGMVIFLCAWAMLFCGLFLAYGVVRSSAVAWPPPGVPRVPRALPLMNAAVLIAASVAYRIGQGALRSGSRSRAVQALSATLALGGMFLALQAAMSAELLAHGLTLDSGAYGELCYVFIGFHALHLAVAEGAVVYVMVQIIRSAFSAARMQPVRLWGMYWHSVTALWCLTVLLVFLP